jgi:hypothetical protein
MTDVASLIVSALLRHLRPAPDDEHVKLTTESAYVAPTALEYASVSPPRHLSIDAVSGLCTVQTLALADDAALVNLSDTGAVKFANNASLIKSARAKAKVDASKAPRSGSGWFDMASSTVDERARSDMQALAVRHIADPSRRYKVERRGAPGSRFFQLGTVIEGRGEFYSSRLKRKDRKASLTDELLDNRDVRELVKKRMQAAADEAPRFRKRTLAHGKKSSTERPSKKKPRKSNKR